MRKKSINKKSNPVALFIVEGYTEENYVKILKQLYLQNVITENCLGGGANSVLLQAEKILSDREEASYYTSFVIIYDSDTDNPKYNHLRTKISQFSNVELLMLDPCFENWLLVHVHDKKVKNTDDCDRCIFYLKKYIPNYEKRNFKLLEKYVNKETFNQACKKQPIIGKVFKEYFYDA